MVQWRSTYLIMSVLGVVLCAGAHSPGDGLAQLAERLAVPAARRAALPALMSDVENALRTRWPESRVQLYGSMASGLAQHDSDVDLDFQTRSEARPSLYQVQSVLAQHPTLFSDFNLLEDIPVLKMKHVPSGFDVDLGIRLEGALNTKLTRYLLGSGVKRHLTLLVKHWGKLRQIFRHLPGYGVVQLVIFYLQQKHMLPPIELLQKNAEPCYMGNWNFGFDEIALNPRNNETLYELLGGFFEFYEEFHFDEYIVSTFVAYPVKRKLFEDLRTVPNNFSLYVRNVESHVSTPLNVSSSACIQNPFRHNKNVGELLDVEAGLRGQLSCAARTYRENDERAFIQQILTTK